MEQSMKPEESIASLRWWIAILALATTIHTALWIYFFFSFLPITNDPERAVRGGFVMGREFILLDENGQGVGRWNKSGGFVPRLDNPLNTPPPTQPPRIGP